MKTAKSLVMAVACVCLMAVAQVPPAPWVIQQKKGVIGSSITLDQAPKPNGLLIVATECGYVSGINPHGVASQWIYAANGMARVGVPPFAPDDQGRWRITCVQGRTPPPAPLTVIEWAQ